MKKLLNLILLIFLFIGSPYSSISQTEYDEMLQEYYKNTVPQIHPKTLYSKMLKGEKIHLLDTRKKVEFEVSTLKGALHVGFVNYKKSKISHIPKDEMIVVYCTIGARSESIGEKIQKAGYKKVYNLYGGIIEWVNKGYPLYKNDTETKNVHVYSKEWGKWLKKGNAVY
jgi:rhodanese-related sulfurtransferase